MKGNSHANSMSTGDGPGSPYWRQSFPACLLRPVSSWGLTIGEEPS